MLQIKSKTLLIVKICTSCRINMYYEGKERLKEIQKGRKMTQNGKISWNTQNLRCNLMNTNDYPIIVISTCDMTYWCSNFT